MRHASLRVCSRDALTLGARACGLSDALRAYLKQAREETGARLVTRCYNADGTPNKFWMAFSRRKFMNKELS